jgi:hypothetical protein
MVGVCKFCGCTEATPCFIPASFVSDPDFRPNGNVVPCAWLLDDVCSNPACVDKAFAEARPLAETIQKALDLGLIEVAA